MLGVRKAHQSTWFLNESRLKRIINLFCSESTEKYCSNLQEYFIPLLSLHGQKPRHSYSTQSEFEFIIKHFACPIVSTTKRTSIWIFYYKIIIEFWCLRKKKNSDILPKKSIHGFILLVGPECCNKEKILQDTCSNYTITTQGHSRNKYSLAASREEWTNQREARQSKKMIRRKQVKSKDGH
jgi:hypothetical protein